MPAWIRSGPPERPSFVAALALLTAPDASPARLPELGPANKNNVKVLKCTAYPSPARGW
jgi:hypothetical protein